MPDYNYLIIGGGMTADAAVRGIRQRAKSERIGIISSESHLPYNRPPLSKSLWKGEPFETIWRNTPTDNVDILLSRTVTSVDPGKKIVRDDTGKSWAFDKLLFANGGRARRLPNDVEGIIYFRTLDDFYKLKSLTQEGQTFAVIGGGFIGSEVAAALSINKKSVTMIFPEDGIGARIFPPALSKHLNMYFEAMDVEVIAKDTVLQMEKNDSGYLLKTAAGKELSVDGVVAGIGLEPNSEIAQSAGLAVDNGIIVDEFLQTSHPDIYAAGDVANFYNPALGTRMRVEHEDNANTMGEIAGQNLAGSKIVYDHLPYFYSDLFQLGYEAVGDLDPRYEMVEEWKEEFEEGVVYYLYQGRVRGVLLWNTWGQINAARSLIADKGPFTANNVRGRLPG
jgi:3-phenylpropionate/trans-cinnamate dioxygenase ferredoxin reductase component